MKFVGLARVSTEDQAGTDGAGLERQRHSIRSLVERFGGTLLQIVDIIAVSGTDVAGSAEWQDQVVPLLERTGASLAVDSLDRLIRGDKFRAYEVLGYLQDRGIRVYTPDGPVDWDSPDGFLTAGLKTLFGGLERLEIKRRTIKGKEEKRKKGLWVSDPGRPPMGFAFTKFKDGGEWSTTLEIHKVQDAYAAILAGQPVASVCKNILGLADGNGRKVLRNPIYRGVITWDKRVDPKDPGKKRGTGNGKIKRLVQREDHNVITARILPPDQQPVSDAVWTAVQQRMDEIAGRRLESKATREGECWATGHLVDVGSLLDALGGARKRPNRLFGHEHAPGHWRYQTANASWSIHADRMHFALNKWLNHLVVHEGKFMATAVRAATRDAADAIRRAPNKAALQKELTKLDRELEKANDKYDVDTITLDQLKAIGTRVRADKARIEAMINAPTVEMPETTIIWEAAAKLVKWPADDTEKRAWLQMCNAEIALDETTIHSATLTLPVEGKAPIRITITGADGLGAISSDIATLCKDYRPARLAGVKTTPEVATMFGLTAVAMRKRIRRGKLPAPASVIGGDGRRWTEEDIDAVRAVLDPAPVPPAKMPANGQFFSVLDVPAEMRHLLDLE